MSCGSGASNYERTKAALINANKWKSNFVNIWEQYGTFKTVNEVQCFDYYDIDGDGEGQRRMSKQLKQPNLWADIMDDDLDWVHLVFKLDNMVELSDEAIQGWIDETKTELETYEFDHLHYVVTDDKVISSYFSFEETNIDNEFLNNLAFLIAEYANVAETSVTYNAEVTLAEVNAMVDDLGSYSLSPDAEIVFNLAMIENEIRSYSMEKSIGTSILDDLVMDGVLIGIGNVSTGTMTYAFPVDVARKMNGHSFVKLIENALDFEYKEDSHWYDFFLDIAKLILAGIAAYFGQYSLAASLVLSFVADKTDSKILQLLSTVVGMLQGDFTAFSTLGVSEAVKLIMNVYSLYTEMAYTPEPIEEEEAVDNDQHMFYKAPYEVYNCLYDYKSLTSVTLTNKY